MSAQRAGVQEALGQPTIFANMVDAGTFPFAQGGDVPGCVAGSCLRH
jgi:hypothetical protein